MQRAYFDFRSGQVWLTITSWVDGEDTQDSEYDERLTLDEAKRELVSLRARGWPITLTDSFKAELEA